MAKPGAKALPAATLETRIPPAATLAAEIPSRATLERKLEQAVTVDCFDDIVLFVPLVAPLLLLRDVVQVFQINMF